MNYVRKLIVAIIVMVFLYCAWYGAEMLIHGESQRSVVDIIVTACISISVANSVERRAVVRQRLKHLAEETMKEKESVENGKTEES